MDKMQFFVALCIAVVIIGLLLILYIREICRRKKFEKRLTGEMDTYRRIADETTAIYERLFPKRILELLGIRKVTEISTRLSRTFMASIMTVNTMDYTKAIHTMTSGELFHTLNRIFAAIIPKITGSGGVIEKFEKAGLTGLYLESEEAALMAAISLCEAVDQAVGSENSGNLSIGLDYGEVMLGIAGHEERLSPVAMSESMSISEFLQTKGEKYGVRIMATESFTRRVPDFRKIYNSRLLGYFYDGTRKNMVKVYDIYDGDRPEQKQGKRRTRMIFEQGVDRFIHGEYSEARLFFVEVLKADRYDLAAREYLYLCDICGHDQQDGTQICIERF